MDIKDFKKSLELLQQCLKISELKWGKKNLDYANSLNFIGLVYWNLDDYNKSIEYYNSSLKIRKEILEKNMNQLLIHTTI